MGLHGCEIADSSFLCNFTQPTLPLGCSEPGYTKAKAGSAAILNIYAFPPLPKFDIAPRMPVFSEPYGETPAASPQRRICGGRNNEASATLSSGALSMGERAFSLRSAKQQIQSDFAIVHGMGSLAHLAAIEA